MTRARYILLLLAIASVPSSAFAQDIDWGPTIGLNLLTSTSTTSVLGMSFVSPISSSTSSTTETLFGSVDHTDRYLEHNSVALAHDITMGGGETLEDLAQLCGLHPTKHAAFASLVRRHRKELVRIMNGVPGDDRALAFAQLIEDAMAMDPALSAHVARRRVSMR
ncbi:MAG: DUF3015 family protein [Myxococcota bacterium]